jgi:hypothetical protein
VSGPSPGPGIGWPRAKGLNSPRPPPRAPARHSHRPIETRDEAEPDGIVPTENAIGIVLVAGAKAVVAFLGPTIFDDDVVALEVAGFRKSLAKCSLVRPRGLFLPRPRGRTLPLVSRASTGSPSCSIRRRRRMRNSRRAILWYSKSSVHIHDAPTAQHSRRRCVRRQRHRNHVEVIAVPLPGWPTKRRPL